MTPNDQQRYTSPIKRHQPGTPSDSLNNSLRSAGDSITRSGEFIPPRTSQLPPSGRQTGRSYGSKNYTPQSSGSRAGSSNGLVLRSQSANNNFSSSERLILQSSNGAPRVQMTPAEKREAKSLADDVNSVRDLM